MATIISYMDVRYRRIPNKLVLVVLVGGLTLNTIFGGFPGLLVSFGGFVLAFGVMFFFHAFGTLGAGDVKLFAAIGAINGVTLVLPTLMVVALMGGLLAIFKMVYSRRVGTTMFGVFQFFVDYCRAREYRASKCLPTAASHCLMRCRSVSAA